VDVPIVVESENKKAYGAIFLRMRGLSYKIRRILRRAAETSPRAKKEQEAE
jgi:hypothetical protein